MVRIKKMMVTCVGLLCFITTAHGQNANESTLNVLDVEKARPLIEGRDDLYSEYLLQGDSVSIAAMYTTDGKIGCKTGAEILSSAGSWIRSNIKNDSRYVSFKTLTLNSDGDLLIETGVAEGKNEQGEVKYTFRYLVVWKQEDGVWKIYRDVGL